jgi:alpha-glucosidase
MENNVLRRLFLVLMTVTVCHLSASSKSGYRLFSPDKKIMVEVRADGGDIIYSVSCNSKMLLTDSKAMLNVAGNKAKTDFTSLQKKRIKETVKSPFYRFSSFSNDCNEMTFRVNKTTNIIFRAYNEGVAYRFVTLNDGDIVIDNETADYHFAVDGNSYMAFSTNEKNPFAMAFQNIYTVKKLSEQGNKLAFLPVTVDCGEAKVTLMESDLRAYPGMFVKAEGTSLKGVFAPYPKTMIYHKWRKMTYVDQTESYISRGKGSRSYPWRVIAVTSSDTDMPVNNMVYALAEPNKIGDCSWIKPGKVSWDWWNDWNLKGVPFKAGINMDTYKYYIDFASRNGLRYIILDEGWYNTNEGDIMHSIADINVKELVDYGREKGVGIVLWTVFNVLDDHLEEACRTYSALGVKGFKVDFMDRDDQTATEMAYRIADMAAKYHLILDYHGFYKPTGMNRTYPNLLNIESVFGMEEMKWNEDRKDMPMYDVTFPYVRMMSGYVDYTPGAMRNASKEDYRPVYNDPMSMGTRCHQMATYIVFDSPFTMLADAPSNYKGNEDCLSFISTIPDVPEFTKVLCGEIGKYIVTARRNGDEWNIGGLTNWDARDVDLDFSFLEKDATYKAVLFKDGVNADKNAEDYAVDSLTVTAATKLKLCLASGGGFTMRLIKK